MSEELYLDRNLKKEIAKINKDLEIELFTELYKRMVLSSLDESSLSPEDKRYYDENYRYDNKKAEEAYKILLGNPNCRGAKWLKERLDERKDNQDDLKKG